MPRSPKDRRAGASADSLLIVMREIPAARATGLAVTTIWTLVAVRAFFAVRRDLEAVREGLATVTGVAVWLHSDDFRGKCLGKRLIILKGHQLRTEVRTSAA